MKKLFATLSCLSFFYVYGVVGSIECETMGLREGFIRVILGILCGFLFVVMSAVCEKMIVIKKESCHAKKHFPKQQAQMQ